jgi:hypothetical protein
MFEGPSFADDRHVRDATPPAATADDEDTAHRTPFLLAW